MSALRMKAFPVMEAKTWPRRRLMTSLLGPVMDDVGERSRRYGLLVETEETDQ
jgi:hypothetical protein